MSRLRLAAFLLAAALAPGFACESPLLAKKVGTGIDGQATYEVALPEDGGMLKVRAPDAEAGEVMDVSLPTGETITIQVDEVVPMLEGLLSGIWGSMKSDPMTQFLVAGVGKLLFDRRKKVVGVVVDEPGIPT